MKTLTAREANQQFSRLLGEVADGEEVVITRRGEPVATLAPLSRPADDARARSRSCWSLAAKASIWAESARRAMRCTSGET